MAEEEEKEEEEKEQRHGKPKLDTGIHQLSTSTLHFPTIIWHSIKN